MPQSVMPTYMGLAVGINSNHQIEKIQNTRNTVSKAASYTCLVTESGTVFDTTGATGAVTFTLPAVADATGVEYNFVNTVNQDMAITAPSGTLVADGNASGTTATFSTSGHKIGGCIHVVCNGAKWLILSVGNTAAVATIS